MNLITSFLEASIALTLLLIAFILILIWFFIKSAVKAGVKSAILESNNIIENQKPKKTIDQEIEEEQKGWS